MTKVRKKSKDWFLHHHWYELFSKPISDIGKGKVVMFMR